MPPGRNDPCPCGSGKKYKRCHGLVQPVSAPSMPSGYARAASPDPQALLEAAQKRVDTEDFTGAESLYRELLEQHPDHIDASTALGSLLDHLGRLDEAEAVFRRLVSAKRRPLRPTAITASCCSSKVAQRRWRPSAVSMQPGYAIALDNRRGSGRCSSAREAEQSVRAAAIDERFLPRTTTSARCWRDGTTSGIACFDRALAIDPTFFDASSVRRCA
jgi:tetratricopeptide (TPR) repeat protein